MNARTIAIAAGAILVALAVFVLSRPEPPSTAGLHGYPELQLPRRMDAPEPLIEGPPVLVVTLDGISLDGIQLVPMTNGVPPRDLMRGVLIVPLLDALRTEADTRKEAVAVGAAPFRGRLHLAADDRVHFDVVRTVMYTAGEAEFTDVRFLAHGSDGALGAFPADRPRVTPAQ